MKQVLIIIAVIFPPLALAQGQWSAMGTVNNVYSHNGCHILDSNISDNPCGSAGKFYWSIDDPDAKDMLAMSLSALMAQKQVRVVYDNANPSCQWSAGVASHFMISNN